MKKKLNVTLREKVVLKHRKALYLDFYPAVTDIQTGNPRRREYLKLFLAIDKKTFAKEVKEAEIRDRKRFGKITDTTKANKRLLKELKPLTEKQKISNLNALSKANNIRETRYRELSNPEIYTSLEKQELAKQKNEQIDFVEYFRELAHERKSSNHDNWMSVLNYLVDFTNGKLLFRDVTIRWCERFKKHLLTTTNQRNNEAKLSQNSAHSYFNKIKATLKQAYIDGILQNDINRQVDRIPEGEPKKQRLSMAEVTELVKTPCENDRLRRASIFTILTGMAFAELKHMTWSEVSINSEGIIEIETIRKKSGRDYIIPISKQAYELLGTRRNPQDHVFEGLTKADKTGLPLWLLKAGIDRRFTYHGFRHTYSVLQLRAGTDIYTLSKMLGHSSVRTTEKHYADVLEETKQETTNRIKLAL